MPRTTTVWVVVKTDLTLAECRQQCKDTDKCNYFTHRHRDGWCVGGASALTSQMEALDEQSGCLRRFPEVLEPPVELRTPFASPSEGVLQAWKEAEEFERAELFWKYEQWCNEPKQCLIYNASTEGDFQFDSVPVNGSLEEKLGAEAVFVGDMHAVSASTAPAGLGGSAAKSHGAAEAGAAGGKAT